MKWGRNKSSPPSARSLLITRVFPVSWFSKFKQKGGSPETSSGKKQQRSKLDFPTRNPSFSAGWREAIFYSVVDDEDDAFWRHSFGQGIDKTRKRTGRINPLWYDSADEFQVPALSFKSSGLRGRGFPRGVHRSINDMVMDIERMQEKQFRENILRENGAIKNKKQSRGDVNHQRSRKLRRRAVRKVEAEMERGGGDDGEGKLTKQDREIIPIEPEGMDRIKEEFRDPDEEDYVSADMDGEGSNSASERVSISKYQNLENQKFKEIKGKTKSQLKSATTGRRSHSRKTKHIRTKAYGPKTDCRIQVLENMKRGRQKLEKKETREQATEFNSFAVVKSSFNPREDFRDSMVEMIRYKGIKRPEELEELLACYLTLNPDGYHDLIIKVFQQVWLELSESVC